MPWSSNEDLPESVKGLPSEAQIIFRNVANQALADGKDDAAAMQIGWGAVKQAGWQKSEDGKWVKKSQMSPDTLRWSWGDKVESITDIQKIVDVDEELGYVFGWASVVTKGGQLIKDSQGDVILPEDLEKAVYPFVKFYRNHGENHINIGTGTLIESMVFTYEKQKALGIDLGMEGWWIGFEINKVAYPEVWDKIKTGDYPMFSIGGTGTREEVEE